MARPLSARIATKTTISHWIPACSGSVDARGSTMVRGRISVDLAMGLALRLAARLGDQSAAHPDADRGSPGVDTEAFEELLHVVVDRARRELEPLCDLLVGQAQCECSQQLELTAGQVHSLARDRPLQATLEDLSRDLRLEIGGAGRSERQREVDLLDRCGGQHIA